MSIHYQDDAVTLHHGDALEVLRTMPDGSVDCCVTSPPYFGLRDYGEEGQYGLEPSPAEYVETMRALFAEVRRVLTDDGTLWLNLGDSYAGSGSPSADRITEAISTAASISLSPLSPRSADSQSSIAALARSSQSLSTGPLSGMKQGARNGNRRSRPRGYEAIAAKNLLGIPWRTALALQDDGWILRNDIIWSKSNGMPDSALDRLTTKHEHFFLLSKSPRYWFDLDPIREPHITGDRPLTAHENVPGQWASGTGKTRHRHSGPEGVGRNDRGRNPGDVWTVATQPFAEGHFAVMPAELARRAVLAGCKPGGVVLDPFSGSGTTGMVAGQTGRRYVGIDLNRDYLDLSLRTRLAQSAFIDAESAS